MLMVRKSKRCLQLVLVLVTCQLVLSLLLELGGVESVVLCRTSYVVRSLVRVIYYLLH